MGERARLIPCRDAVRQLWDYLDGSAAEHAEVEAHLTFCRRCCGELEFVEQLRDLLASQSADDIPPELARRMEQFVEEL